MAQEYPKSWKKCGVCDYWGGAREPHVTKSRVNVYDAHAKGKCFNGPYKGKDMQANQACSNFQTWAVVR